MWCVQYYICHPQTSVTRIDRFDHPDETLPTGGAIPPQPDIAGTAPGLPSAPKKDIVNELCPYFQWMPVGNDCTLQVLTGAAVVILGGALLFRLIKPKSADWALPK
ncbi:MAG: hypothetical protein WBP64_02680 [Nitrososphaeraceae archaeon]